MAIGSGCCCVIDRRGGMVVVVVIVSSTNGFSNIGMIKLSRIRLS